MIVIVPMMFFVMLTGSCAHATITLQANGITPAVTFTGNNVSAHAIDSNEIASCFYVGRSDASIPVGSNDGLAEYAISAAREGLTKAFPYAPVTVRLNGVENQPNPVAGQQIDLIGLYTGVYSSKNPIIVTHDNPQNLYWNVSMPGAHPFDMFSIANVTDANGATTAGIVAVTGASIVEKTSVSQISGSVIFAATRPNGGTFGNAGSGIAVIAQSATSLTQFPAVVGSTTVKSVPLDGTQSYVKIGGNATVSATPAPDIYFDPVTQRVYGAFTATNGVGVGNGVRGIVVGYFNPITIGNDIQYTLVLTDFAPAAAYTGAGITRVAGAIEAGGASTVTISKYRSMYTSTGLTYGIVVGSNGGIFPTDQTVSAVPLVNKSVDPSNITWPTDPTQGAMASKIVNVGTNLKTFFSPAYPLYYPYAGRGFQIPATTVADLPTLGESAVWVGGASTPGVINDIQVFKDTVFVATSAGAADTAGVFASQALFDGDGAIKGWTAWQRVATPTTTGNMIYGIGYQPIVGKLFTIEGTAATAIDTVLTTTWTLPYEDGLLGGTTTNASVGFVDLVDSQFSGSQGGIQAAFDFPNTTTGFAGAPNRLSAMIFSGYQRVVLVQTGADVGGIFTPTVGDFSTNMEISTNGAVTTPGAGALIISVTGGALNTIGAITSAVIVNDGAVNAYLVIAGVGGVSVLRPGWPVAGLQKNFQNLPASAFTVIGSYKNVRKLLSDGTNLYVLTNQTFDRIPAAQLAGTITPVTLATPAAINLQPYGQFSDVVVSAKVALLATSQGLLRAGNGANVATATTPVDMAWTTVSLPESQTAVTRLQPLSASGLPEGFSKNGGGTVYVLAGSVNYNLASLYRVSVGDTSGGNVITGTTVQVIPDYFVRSTTSAFAALGAYRNYTTTFGSLITDSESSYDGALPVFEALPSFLRTGAFVMPRRNAPIQANISTAITIGNLLRNSGLGALILPTNNGMRVLE